MCDFPHNQDDKTTMQRRSISAPTWIENPMNWKLPIALAATFALILFIFACFWRTAGVDILEKIAQNEPQDQRRIGQSQLLLAHHVQFTFDDAMFMNHLLYAGSRSGGCLLMAARAYDRGEIKLMHRWLEFNAWSLRPTLPIIAQYHAELAGKRTTEMYLWRHWATMSTNNPPMLFTMIKRIENMTSR